MNFVVGIAVAIFGLSILVIIHEGGHYLAARAFGMRVLRFSIGFGKTIFTYKPEGSPTTFQVAIVPFLAYVEVDGMNPFVEIDPDDPTLFPNQSAPARAIMLAAGPFANYLAAVILAFAIGLMGWPGGMLQIADPEHPKAKRPPHPMIVDGLLETGAAAKAGIQLGDVIIEADGQEIHNIRDLIDATKPRGGKPTTYVAKRDNKTLTFEVTPADMNGVGQIGVINNARPYYVKMDAAEAATAAFVYPWRVTLFQITSIGDMIKKRTTRGLGGPVAMVKGLSAAAESGIINFLTALMRLSVALGFFNLLPFPALDGGRLIFVIYELITRQRPNEKLEAIIHGLGLAFLLSLLVFVTYGDIVGREPELADTPAANSAPKEIKVEAEKRAAAKAVRAPVKIEAPATEPTKTD